MLPLRVHTSPEALFQEIGGDGVILDLASANYFGLDGVGVRLWQLLQENSDLKVACDTILSEYEVEADQLHQDIAKLITQLVDSGLASVE